MDKPFLRTVKLGGQKKIWNPLLRQISVCVTVWSFYFMSGLFTGTPTVVRPQLIQQANNTSDISDDMFSWITSVCAFSGAAWLFILITTAHFFGRKKTTLLISVVMFAASILVFLSRLAMHIFISQLLYGALVAGILAIFPMMVTEYSATRYRGIFLTLKSATFYWGLWTANAIGIFTHYKYIGLLATLISGYCFFMQESPYWLAFSGRYKECIITHRLLKGDDEEAEKELEELIYAEKVKRRNNNSKMDTVRDKLILIRQPEIWKPLALTILVFLIYNLSGKLICAVYAIELMKELTRKESVAHNMVLILDGFSVLGMYVGCGMAKRFKRRTLLLITTAIGVAFLFVMSIYLYLVKLRILTENPYLITVLLVGYSLSICCGPMIMATSIFGELLPMKSRSFCACISSLLFAILSGTILKVFPLMFTNFGIHGSFLFYGMSCLVCIILTYKYLPETKDKSLYEIAALFERKYSAEIQLFKT